MAVVSRRTVGRIRRLRDASAYVAAGDLTTEIDVTSTDEVGDLASSFRQMIEQIRAGHDALEAEKAAVERRVEEAVRASESEKIYLARSVDRMVGEMERFAEGHLDVHLAAEREDEIGKLYEAFRRAAAHIRQMLLQVRASADSTNVLSSQLSG